MERTEKAAVISGVAAAVFAVFLLSAAVFWHSVTFFAGGMLTVSRSVTGFLVAAALRLSKKHTAGFSSGLYKLENLAVTVIGLLLLFGAYELGRLVLFRMHSGEPVMEWSDAGVIALLIATVMGLILGIYKEKVGRKENCPSISADARHSFIDAGAMFIIASGVYLAARGLNSADYAAALLVAAVVFWNGGRIAIDGIRVLLDASIETGLLEEARSIAENHPGVRSVIEVDGRNSGSRRFFALKVIPREHDVHVTAGLTRDLRERIRAGIRNADEVTVEYVAEVQGAETEMVAIPLDGRGLYPASGFAGASAFAILEADRANRRILRRRTMASPHTGTDLRDRILSAVMLARQGVKAVIVPAQPEEKDVGYTFEAYGIRLLQVPSTGGRTDPDEIVREAMEASMGSRL